MLTTILCYNRPNDPFVAAAWAEDQKADGKVLFLLPLFSFLFPFFFRRLVAAVHNAEGKLLPLCTTALPIWVVQL